MIRLKVDGLDIKEYERAVEILKAILNSSFSLFLTEEEKEYLFFKSASFERKIDYLKAEEEFEKTFEAEELHAKEKQVFDLFMKEVGIEELPEPSEDTLNNIAEKINTREQKIKDLINNPPDDLFLNEDKTKEYIMNIFWSGNEYLQNFEYTFDDCDNWFFTEKKPPQLCEKITSHYWTLMYLKFKEKFYMVYFNPSSNFIITNFRNENELGLDAFKKGIKNPKILSIGEFKI